MKNSLWKVHPLEISLPIKNSYRRKPKAKNSSPASEKCTHTTIRKQWLNFITYRPFPRGFKESGYLQKHSYWGFPPCWTKWLPQNFDRTILGKRERGREPCCPPIFLVIIKGSSISLRMSRHTKTTGSIWSPLEKK
jgi:hypothetical protein